MAEGGPGDLGDRHIPYPAYFSADLVAALAAAPCAVPLAPDACDIPARHGSCRQRPRRARQPHTARPVARRRGLRGGMGRTWDLSERPGRKRYHANPESTGILRGQCAGIFPGGWWKELVAFQGSRRCGHAPAG